MLYSGLTISAKPQNITGKLYFTQLGEPYIEVLNDNLHTIRAEVYSNSIQPILPTDKMTSTFRTQ